MVSNFTNLDSTASLHTNNNIFSFWSNPFLSNWWPTIRGYFSIRWVFSGLCTHVVYSVDDRVAAAVAHRENVARHPDVVDSSEPVSSVTLVFIQYSAIYNNENLHHVTKIGNLGSHICKILNEHLKIAKDFFQFCQSGEISANLET